MLEARKSIKFFKQNKLRWNAEYSSTCTGYDITCVAFLRVRDESSVNHAVRHAVTLQGARCVFSAVTHFRGGVFWWVQNLHVVRLDVG